LQPSGGSGFSGSGSQLGFQGRPRSQRPQPLGIPAPGFSSGLNNQRQAPK
jgi:hypothetical protein